MKKIFKWRRTPVLVMAAAGIVISGIVMVMAGQNDNEPQQEAEPLPVIYTDVADLNVYVDGQLSTDLSMNDVVCGETITLHAPGTGEWYMKENNYLTGVEYDKTLSYQQSYTLTVYNDTTLYFKKRSVYSEPVIEFTSKTIGEAGDDKTVQLTATYSLGEGLEAEEVGIRYTDNRMLGYQTSDGNKAGDLENSNNELSRMLRGTDSKYNKNRVADSPGLASGSAGDWTLSIIPQSEDDYIYAMAYVKIGSKYYYSDILTVKYSDLTKGRRMNANVSEPFVLPE